MTHNKDKNESVRTNQELTQMLELPGMDINQLLEWYYTYSIARGKIVNKLSTNMEDTK